MGAIEQSRYDRLIRRITSSVGPGSRVSDIIEDLFPMIDVESDKGELQILGGTELGVAAANTTGAAGEKARHQLFNPLDSGVIATVTGLYFSSATGQAFHVATTTIALTTGIGTEVFRDRRRDVTTRPICQLRTDSTAAQTDGNMIFRPLPNTPFRLHDENDIAILPPGSGIEVGCTTNATTLISTFLWRERPAEQSELQF